MLARNCCKSFQFAYSLEHIESWLTAAQIAELYGRDRSVVFKHIKAVLQLIGKDRGTY